MPDKRHAGELLHDAHYAFAFRTVEPRPESATRLLLLLHGVGGDELQLEPVATRVPGDTLVVLPRGQRSISGGMLGWYRVGLSADGPQVVVEEAEEARLKLIEFIAQLQGRFELPAERTTVAGFSQGGILSASAALTSPNSVGAFAVLCGRLLPEIESLTPEPLLLSHLRALLVHGRDDTTLELDWAHRAAARLAELGIAHELRLHEAGHELTRGMEDDFVEWFTKRRGD